MTLFEAFNASAQLRATALASFSDREIPSGFVAPTVPEREACADRFGLPRAYVHLIAALGDPHLQGGPTSFQAQALLELKIGADAHEIVRQWFIWVHDASSMGLSAILAEMPVRDLAKRIMDLHRQSPSRGVSRAEWRDARKMLNAAAQVLSPEVQAWAAVIEAMAWDIIGTPGVVADVVIAYDLLVQIQNDREVGWSEDCSADFQRLQMECITAAAASFGFKPNNVPPDRRQDVRTKFEHLWDDGGHRNLSKLFERRSVGMNNARAGWRSAAREGLLAITRDLARPEAAQSS